MPPDAFASKPVPQHRELSPDGPTCWYHDVVAIEYVRLGDEQQRLRTGASVPSSTPTGAGGRNTNRTWSACWLTVLSVVGCGVVEKKLAPFAGLLECEMNQEVNERTHILLSKLCVVCA